MIPRESQRFEEELGTVPAVPGAWTYQKLDVDKVKWYYLRPPLSLRAVYGQDILHRADIRRFCLSDSNKLEALYREHTDEIEKAWWVEYTDVGSAVSMPLPGGTKSGVSLPDKDISSASWLEYHLGEDTEAGVLVRGGLYEAHLKHRRLDKCYWPEPPHRILRGTWFIEKAPDWVPLKEPTAEELEAAYRSQIWTQASSTPLSPKSSSYQGARVTLQSLHNEAKGWFALFVGAEEAYLCKDDSISWLSRKLSSKASAPGFRLRRGYDPPAEGVTVQEVDLKAEAAEEEAASLPVNKLLLVVHGIGQNLTGSNIAEDASLIRQGLMANIGEQGGPPEERGRTEVLPVQWRKHLDLDIDKLAASLMPPGIKSLRQILHATAVEVLLYVTPLHCQEMLDSVAASLNLQYSRFMKRNPNFKGEVSVLAHSLGSVLCYDLLCNQSPEHPEANSASMEDGFNFDDPLVSFSKPRARQMESYNSGSLKPLSSYDLDPARDAQGNIGPVDGIDVLDHATQRGADAFGGVGQPNDPFDSFSTRTDDNPELAACRKEIVRLKGELEALRHKHESALGTSLPKTSYQGSGSESASQSLLSPSVDIKQLLFSVDRFITIGSPLGIFLTLRKVNPYKGAGLGSRAAAELMVGQSAKTGDGLPAVKRMFNLYHPFDPVGFRLEPLITAGAEKRRAVFASTGKGSKTIGVGLTELGEDMSAAMSFGAAKASAIFRSSLSTLKLTSTKKQEPVLEDADTEERKLTEKEEAAEVGVQAASRATVSAIWRLTDGPGDMASYPPSRSAAGRLDFVLQSGIAENQWLSAMSSHFAYWASPDVSLFITRALYHHDVHLGAKPAAKEFPKDAAKPPTSPAAAPVSRSQSLAGYAAGPQPMISTLSLPSSPQEESGLISPDSQKSAKSTSFARGKADPADWW